ncbi:MAG: hypothetical protein R3Y46_07900, partial [Opitutales bacterium]
DAIGNEGEDGYVAAVEAVTGEDGDLTIVDTGVSGSTVTLTADGSITSTLDTAISATTANLTATGNVTLTNAGNDFTGLVTVSGVDLSIVDANDISLEVSATTGDISVTAGTIATITSDINANSFYVEAQKVTVENVYTEGDQVYNVSSLNPNKEGNGLNNPIEINGTDLISASGDITLGSDLSSVPTSATIVALNGDLNISADNVSMGANQSLLSSGNITITASTSATLSDISTPEFLTVDTPVVNLLLRDAMSYTNADGEVITDNGLSFIASGFDFGDAEISLVEPTSGEYLSVAYFSTRDGIFSDNLTYYYVLVDDTISLSTFVDAETGLLVEGVVAGGYSIENPATSLGDLSSTNISVASPLTSMNASILDDLSNLGINTRENSAEEMKDDINNSQVNFTQFLNSIDPDANELSVAGGRISAEQSEKILDLYNSIYKAQEPAKEETTASEETDSATNEVADATTDATEVTASNDEANTQEATEEKATEEAQVVISPAERMQKNISSAYQKYAQSAEGETSIEGFKNYLEANASENAEVLSDLAKLNKLFTAISQLGLTARETNVSKTAMVEPLKMSEISADNLVKLVDMFSASQSDNIVASN